VDKLKQLMGLCKCGVFVTINEHRDYYMSVAEYIKDEGDRFACDDAKVISMMEQTDTIVEVQFYQFTPVAFMSVAHYDLDAALDKAIALALSRASREVG